MFSGSTLRMDPCAQPPAPQYMVATGHVNEINKYNEKKREIDLNGIHILLFIK